MARRRKRRAGDRGISRDEQRQEEDTQHEPRCMANRFSIFATLFLLLSAQRGGSVRVEQSAFMREKGMQLKRKGMHVEALTAFERAVQMNPADPASVIALTQASLQVKKNKTEVLRILDDALANSPDSPELIATYGLYAETLLNNAQIAEAMYRRSIEINPKNPTTINNLASLIENVNRTEASRLYNMALALDPQNVPNMCNYAGFLWKCSTLEAEETAAGEEDREKAAGAAAAKLLTTALTLEPNNAHVLLNFGALMEDWAENYALAKEIYRKALRIDPENLNAVAYFSRTLRKEGQYEKATAILKRSLAKHPSDNTLRRELWRVNAQIKIENEKKESMGGHPIMRGVFKSYEEDSNDLDGLG